MEADDILDLGSFCDNLIADPHFQILSAQYEQQLGNEWLSTKPHETKAREFAYAKLIAHREFIAHLADIVLKKNEAVNKDQPPTDPLDIIDDPAVHNIFD